VNAVFSYSTADSYTEQRGMVLEELQPCRLGRHPVDYVGNLLWLLLVEGHRYEPFDSLTVVEGYRSQGLWGVMAQYCNGLHIL
jgi:hypothetical protein